MCPAARGEEQEQARTPQPLRERERGHLRLLTCGSVDDGKSTLIGRLLYDAKLLFEDHERALTLDSRRYGTTGDDLDFALLLDGLEAEREQGITIDVAWRFFATDRRAFIVADTPGHEQYTRNMAMAASTADLAVLMVDARKGLLTQTKRHTVICALLGVRHIVLAVNKIDLVSYAKDVFDRIVGDYAKFAAQFGFCSLVPIPVSARFGDNVTAASDKTPWYAGPPLLAYLESIDIESDLAAKPFRFSVQWISRPNADFRGFSGAVASGVVRVGDEVVILPMGAASRVARIVTTDGDRKEAAAGDAVTLTLTDDIDVSRGDMIVPRNAPAQGSFSHESQGRRSVLTFSTSGNSGPRSNGRAYEVVLSWHPTRWIAWLAAAMAVASTGLL